MAYSKRYTTTRDERIELITNQKMNTGGIGKNKVSALLEEPNVKNFNRTLLKKTFCGGQQNSFESAEECKQEMMFFFDLCDKNNIIPTITSLCLYLGIHKDTLYVLSKKDDKTADYCRKAIDICHNYLQFGALTNTVSPSLYMFLSKNYYGMQDNTTVNLTSTQNTLVSNVDTMNAIKEQIALEYNMNDAE